MIYVRHLISGSRLPFTAAYFGSIAMTLYFAIGVSPCSLLVMNAVDRAAQHFLHVHAVAVIPSPFMSALPFQVQDEMSIAQPNS
jgi:hypothetical protein